MPTQPVHDNEGHEMRVAREVLNGMDRVARHVGPTQALPPGVKRMTATDEDAVFDYVDEAALPQAQAMYDEMSMMAAQALSHGMPVEDVARYVTGARLKIASLVFPKRFETYPRTRPTLTEQAKWADQQAKRAERRVEQQLARGEQRYEDMPTAAPIEAPDPPDPDAPVDGEQQEGGGYWGAASFGV